MPLSSSGFEPTVQPVAPTIPSSVGVLSGVDYDRVQQMALDQHQSDLATLAAQGQAATVRSNVLSSGVQRAGEQQTQQQQAAQFAAQAPQRVLAGAQASAQLPLVGQQAGLTSTLLAGQQTGATQSNALLAKGRAVQPGYLQQLNQIAALPDPNERYNALSALQTQNADWLALPNYQGAAQRTQDLAQQSLGLVQARSAQAAKLAQINAAGGYRTGAAQIGADARLGAATTAAQARIQSAGGADNVASQHLTATAQAVDAAQQQADQATAALQQANQSNDPDLYDRAVQAQATAAGALRQATDAHTASQAAYDTITQNATAAANRTATGKGKRSTNAPPILAPGQKSNLLANPGTSGS